MNSEIKGIGWSVLRIVDPDTAYGGFEYTIGNHERGLAELLVFCHDGKLINDICEKMRNRNRPFEHGELVDAGCRQHFKVVNARRRAHDEYTIQVGEYYRTKTTACNKYWCRISRVGFRMGLVAHIRTACRPS